MSLKRIETSIIFNLKLPFSISLQNNFVKVQVNPDKTEVGGGGGKLSHETQKLVKSVCVLTTI